MNSWQKSILSQIRAIRYRTLCNTEFMTTIKISWKSICASPLTAGINVLLIAFGTGILTLLLLASDQIGRKLESGSRNIDLVVGAKGSPLQLILSSVYHADFPTGNIPLKEAEKLAAHPMVEQAVPLALGDNYAGFRIVGTDSGFAQLYGLAWDEGGLWKNDFEVTVGAAVARKQGLKIGDTFFGAHGLSGEGHVHDQQAYRVTGILEPGQNVADQLVLTNISSVWLMHDEHKGHEEHEHGEDDQEDHPHESRHEHGHEEHEHDHEHSGHQASEHTPPDHHQHGTQERGRNEGNRQEALSAKQIQQEMYGGKEEEQITSLLIRYRSPAAVAAFPRMVNESTGLQAASPAMESARLFSLIGIGIDTLQWLAALIMGISAVSIFASLYNSLKERRYDLAVMRTLGASRGRLFLVVIFEGMILTATGAVCGIAAGHLALHLLGHFQDTSQAQLTGMTLLLGEIGLLATGFGIGILAALIPALQAYRSNISGTLSNE